ncbi:hypothetical protein ACKWTF_016481 [Chironomus riparius]
MGDSCTNSEILFAIVSIPFVIYTGASFLINAATADEGIIIAIPATLISLGSLVFFLAAMCRCSRKDKYMFKTYVALAIILAILSTIVGIIQLTKVHQGEKYIFRSIVQLTYPFMCILCSILYFYVEQKDRRERKYFKNTKVSVGY